MRQVKLGLFDRVIERVASEIVKAAPTVTPITEAQIRQALASYGDSAALPRDPRLAQVPFGAGVPLIPGAINPVREDGRPDPRRYEYQVAQNINVSETRLVPFKTLRAAGDQIDILRRCIEVTKAKLSGLDWDIVLAPDAAEKVMKETGEKSYTRAMGIAKEKFTEEITRAKSFWKTPDISNGLIFSDWLNMALEDILVLDAWAVWPQKTVGGELKGLQILDGATIKPLIDDRGMRPEIGPAFQQILFGFPRSEFAAPVEVEEADGEFSSDEMAYLVRNRRTTSVYGFSPVERALPLADIYLRRQQWLRAEYTDGVIPELILKSDGNFTPDQLRAYENILNDHLAGQTEQRKRASILPQGLEPIQMDGYGEKFKDVLDDYLVTSICGHFGVQPTEIGMMPKSGLGGKGMQEGQGESSEVLAGLPLALWMGKMLSHLSYVFLGMPRELEFRFMPSGRNDSEAEARQHDIRVKNGTLSLNEARSESGLPLLSAPEADSPIYVAGNNAFLVTDGGLVPLAGNEVATPSLGNDVAPEIDTNAEGGKDNVQAVETGAGDAVKPVEDVKPEVAETIEDKVKAAQGEIKAFIKWVRKSPNRSFAFEHLPKVYAETLNKFVAVEDFDGARWYAERYLG